jgi:cell division protein FtsQ
VLRLKLAGALAVVGLLYGGWLWLRDTSLFAVNSVTITGLSGATAAVIRDSLTTTAHEMTTTDVQVGKLRAAVAPFTSVKDLRVRTSFPHGMQIQVIEQQPVAALVLNSGRRLPVAADGTVIQGLGAPSSLPSIAVQTPPAGRRVTDASSVQAVALLAAAPSALRDRTTRVANSTAGLTAYLRRGPAIYFGDATRLHAKWAAATSVLADRGSRGAVYVDVRMPDRPTAQVGDPATTLGGAGSASGGGLASPYTPSPSIGG